MSIIFHTYSDEIKLLVVNFAARALLAADTIASQAVTRSGAAGGTLVTGSPAHTPDAVSVRVSGGTPLTPAPANPEDDALDVVQVVATTTGGLVWQGNIGLRMRQPGAVRTRYSKYQGEVLPYTFDYSGAVGAPYADPLVTTPGVPVVAPISGPDSLLTIGTPSIVAVGALATAGVQVRVSGGTVGATYVLGCLVYTSRLQRLRINLALTIRAANDL